jgi:NAD(P)-dependent dehydrogenase (short-subunit alcohol dehydrogenase family)
MMVDLEDRVAVVTGGASGIGRGICLALARQGAGVAVVDLNGQGAEAVASEVAATGVQSVAVTVDVTDRPSVDNMVTETLGALGKIDILVNAAGVVGAANWWESEFARDEDWDVVMAVNLRGVVAVSERVAVHMKARRYGKIVNIASIAARQGSAVLSHYNASKAAVLSWTQSSALQLAPYDINVNAICPGLLWTPMWDQIARKLSGFSEDPLYTGLSGRDYFNKMVESLTPLKREQTPEDIGKLAAFLASDDSLNITGQAINVDGGRRMN